ncbi:hypothetical protein [Amycolatopsis sp. H20-H5]|uniref:hypothetical protein n=1 Tax=Amycolatopsis sp. H20-H5 TaxID=3046309 RepID=UPI002DBCE5D4|nr:hypothetical protein [Amycolatopsis sp. H20-H5]MEC3979947.1 hypothetical protein [Amycolatopsis sp. H20-H5]
MSDWSKSRAKARIDRRELLDELTARTSFEVRVQLNGTPAVGYDDPADIFGIGHTECAALLAHRRVLPLWERLLLARYARRVHGRAIVGSVAEVPTGGTPAPLSAAFPHEIAALASRSGDTGAKYDMQGRGLLTVFRIAVGKGGEVWADREDVATTSARNILTCTSTFTRRKPWHVLWPVYRVRGLRVWKL